MTVARTAVLVAGFLLAAAACGADEPSRPAGQVDGGSAAAIAQQSSDELPDLARALVPREALADPVDEDEFAVEECGIQPVFLCVRVYFVTEDIDLEERVKLVRRQVGSAGWDVVAERRENGVILEIERGAYGGEYMLEPDDAGLCLTAARCVTGTMLTIVGPPAPLPAPSESEREAWSAEKRAFIEDANAICAEMQARMTASEEIPAALEDGLEALSALEPPSDEETRVDRILRSLRILVKAARALTDDEGEDALPAAVAVGEFTKGFNEAASRYGLDVCARLG